jgi:hypothetical protein
MHRQRKFVEVGIFAKALTLRLTAFTGAGRAGDRNRAASISGTASAHVDMHHVKDSRGCKLILDI